MFDDERSFNYFEYQNLYKDFCYMKPFVLQFNTSSSSTKCSVQEQIQFKNNKCVLEDKIQVQRLLGENGKLKLSSTLSSFKLFYSHRLPQQRVLDSTTKVQQKQNPVLKQKQQIGTYTAIYTDRKLQNASFQIGFQRTTQRTYINSNITNFIYKHKNEYFLYAKMLYFTQKIKMGFLSIIDIASRNLQTNNLVFEYQPYNNHKFSLRGQVDGLRNYSLNYKHPKSYFDFLACNYIFRPTNSLSMMAQLKYNVENGRIQKIESMIEKVFDDRKLKVCLNHQGDVTMQIGVPLQLGEDSRINFGLLFSDIMKSRKISYGFNVTINT